MNHNEWVLLKIATYQFALPRVDVRELISCQDIVFAPGASVKIQRGLEAVEIPVLMFDKALNPSHDPQDARRICVVLAVGEPCFGLCCDEFDHQASVHEMALVQHPLPRCMHAPGAALQAVLQLGAALYALSSAQALLSAYAKHFTRAQELS